MNSLPQGIWRSIRSSIPGYRHGTEVLSFSADQEHEWRIEQRDGSGRPSINRFRLEEEGDHFRMCLVHNGSIPSGGYTVQIQKLSDEEITVTPEHGHTTVFKRETEPNKSVQINAVDAALNSGAVIAISRSPRRV